MFTVRTIVLPVVALMLAAGTAPGQTIKNSTYSGVIVTKSATIAPSMTAVVYTTPAAGSGFFILTQLCVDNLNRVSLSGTAFGQIVNSTSDECTRYTPGLTFAPGESIQCTNSAGSAQHFCTITGTVVTK